MSDLAPNTPATRPGSTGDATFYGTYSHKITGRNQVSIPRNMKHVIDQAHEGQLLLLRWNNEPFLRMYTKDQFDTKLKEVKQNPKLTPAQKSLAVTSIARGTETIEPDTQGRFVLPGKWVDALNIRDEVTFCGAFTYIEVWPADRHRETEKAAQEALAPVAADVTEILNM